MRWRLLLIGLIAVPLAAAQAAWLSAWPAPWNRLDLLLILAAILVANFGKREAFALLAGSGLALDLVRSAPLGLHLLAALLLAAVLQILFSRVFTNLSVVSFAGLNAVGFLTWRALLGIIDLIVNGRLTWDVQAAAGLGLALVLQVVLSLACLRLYRIIARSLQARFILRHD